MALVLRALSILESHGLESGWREQSERAGGRALEETNKVKLCWSKAEDAIIYKKWISAKVRTVLCIVVSYVKLRGVRLLGRGACLTLPY